MEPEIKKTINKRKEKPQAAALVVAEPELLAQLFFDDLTSSWRYSITCGSLRLIPPARLRSKT